MPKRTSQLFRPRSKYFYLEKQVFESDGFRALDCVSRSLLLELMSLYVPVHREEVFLSTRDAAKRLKVNKDTAASAFKTLEASGIIKLVTGAIWIHRQARTWRITFFSFGNREPTDDWKNHDPYSGVVRER